MQTNLARDLRRAIAAGHDARKILAQLSPAECEEILFDWRGIWARPTTPGQDEVMGRPTWTGQLPPPVPWDVWLLLAGRGFGKTRTAAEWVRDEAKKQQVRIALVGQDPTDARLVMILGESGIMAVTPERERPTYNPSTKLLNWPNGSIGEVHSSHNFEALRGPQFHRAWVDELCAMRYARQTWDNLSFGMRLVAADGSQPKTVISTTPKPIQLLKEIIQDQGTQITVGTTFDNTENLSAGFMARVVRRYDGTSIGAQELYAKMIDEVKGALWTRENLERWRATKPPEMRRVVVAVDPMARASENARRRVAPPETGIIVAGIGTDGVCYVLDDRSQANAKPDVWGRKVVEAFHDHKADRVVAEVNQGGDMVEDVLRTREKTIPFRSVTASRGKRVRAEPVSALYEQGRVRHVGFFGKLEDQLCTWTGEDGEPSPDRLDALVWAITDLTSGVAEAADIDYNSALGRGANEWRTM